MLSKQFDIQQKNPPKREGFHSHIYYSNDDYCKRLRTELLLWFACESIA